MKHFAVFLISNIYLTTSLAFETGRYFSQIDEINALAQTAYRSYTIIDDQTKRAITVQLIGMTHKATPEFYSQIEGLIENKVVLYERCGSTLEMIEDKKTRIMNLLSEEYQNRYLNSLGKPSSPNSLGQVSEEDFLSYKKCKELIHADAGPEPQTSEKDYDEEDLSSIVEYGNADDLKNFIDKQILNQMENYGIMCDKSDIDENLPLLNERFEKYCRSKPSRNILSMCLREEVKNCNQDIDKIRKLGHLGESEDPWERFIKIDRNNFIFNALNDLWNRDEIPAEIAITYGAGHLPIVEDYLLRQGFKPLEGSDGWLTVANLVPLPPKF